MKKKVYICSPLGGKVEENLEKVKRYTEYALKAGVAPVVPHFYALCLDDDIPAEREIGLSAGLSLLWYCDEMWVFGDALSPGMKEEIGFCRNMKIPVRKIQQNEIEKVIGEEINDKEEISENSAYRGASAVCDDGNVSYEDVCGFRIG